MGPENWWAKNKIVTDFFGEYDFLRSDYRANLIFREELFPSAEHAYQAAKDWDNVEWRKKILDASSPQEARLLGQEKNSADWEKIKLLVLEEVQKAKFGTNFEMKLRLLMTAGYEIEQSEIPEELQTKNSRGKTKNVLGQMLVRIRDEIEKSEGSFKNLFLKFLSSQGMDCMKPWLDV